MLRRRFNMQKLLDTYLPVIHLSRNRTPDLVNHSYEQTELDSTQSCYHYKLHYTKFNYHFITAILKSQKSVSIKLSWSSRRFVETGKQKGFYISSKRNNAIQSKISAFWNKNDAI